LWQQHDSLFFFALFWTAAVVDATQLEAAIGIAITTPLNLFASLCFDLMSPLAAARLHEPGSGHQVKSLPAEPQ
jgi:hypothetical protein